jgi:hypothetical protein
MENNVLPFSNSDFAQNGYEPLSGGDFQTMLTEWIKYNHGELQIRPTVENAMEKDVTTIQKMVVNLYKVKKYTYERLYNSTLLKYEPIENYDRLETITDSTIKDTTGSTDYGLQNTTSSITSDNVDGAQKNDNTTTEKMEYGETTTVIKDKLTKSGKERSTDSGKKVSERNVAPYDSETYYNQEKTTDSFDNYSHTNELLDRIDETNSTVNVPTKTDNKTTTVIENIGEKTNTQTSTSQQQQQAHTDTVTGKEVVTYKHENHTHGNIGVTTSQQMLESEREVALFNFVGIVAHDIIKLIAICIY